MTLKWARIADFCDKLSGFADFESRADRGLTENFGPDSGLFMSGSSDRKYQNDVWITLVGLRRCVGEIVAQRSHKTKLVKKKNWYKNIICRSLQDLIVKLHHTNFSRNADSDLNENSGGLTDLAKK